MSATLQPFLLSLHIAAASTTILLLISLPLSWWLARTRSFPANVLRMLINAPLVLPPSVLGFYFLVTFSPTSPVGGFIDRVAGIRMLFTLEGLIVGSVLFSVPYMVNPLLAGFEALPVSLTEAAWVLGKSRPVTFVTVILPNARHALLAGVAMTFVHAMGEFGLVLMIGGKIPGATMTGSIAVFDAVESLRYEEAHLLALLLAVVSFSALGVLTIANRKVRPV